MTEDPNTRFHSCDSRGVCPVRDTANVVQIIPVTTRKPIRHHLLEPGLSNPGFSIEGESAEVKTLKRKHGRDLELERNPKRVKELIMKEPGHTLLEPKESWWVCEGSSERPTLLSATGELLPYYLVCTLRPVTDFIERAFVPPLVIERTPQPRRPFQASRSFPMRRGSRETHISRS